MALLDGNGYSGGGRMVQAIPLNQSFPENGLFALTPEGTGRRIYLLHGDDGDALGPGMSLGPLPYQLGNSYVAALLYDDEAFACESLSACASVYARRIQKDAPGTQPLLVAQASGAALACMVSKRLQAAGLETSLMVLDSEAMWGSAPRNALLRDAGVAGEAEAALWLARVVRAPEFAWQRVQDALATSSTGTAFPGGPARFLSQVYGHCAAALKDYGIKSIEGFRSVCSLATSNSERLRNLVQTEDPTMRGMFSGKTTLVAGGREPEECAAKSLRAVCSSINVTSVQNVAMTVDTILDFAYGPQKQLVDVPGILSVGSSTSRRMDPDDIIALGESPDDCYVYMLPGLDGGLTGHLTHFGNLLKPYHAFQLQYDHEARVHTHVLDLASALVRRILQHQSTNDSNLKKGTDVDEDTPLSLDCKIVLIGHTVAAAVAYAMALLFQEQGIEVALVVVQGDVAFPNNIIERGGENQLDCSWFGGECEAALMLARIFGAAKFAQKEEQSLRKNYLFQDNLTQNNLELAYDDVGLSPYLDEPFVSVDAEATSRLIMRTFWEISDQVEETSVDDFKTTVSHLATLLNWLKEMSEESSSFMLDEFLGRALLVAADKPSDAIDAQIAYSRVSSLRATASLYCPNLDVCTGHGNLDGLLEGNAAASVAEAVLEFTNRWVWGLSTLRDSEDVAGMMQTCVYLCHDLDGDAAFPGAGCAELVRELDPCRVCVLVYNKEAQNSASLDDLAKLYAKRVRRDVAGRSGKVTAVLAGSNFGAVLAQRVAQLLQAVRPMDKFALVLLGGEDGLLGKIPDWFTSEHAALLRLSRQAGATAYADRAVADLEAPTDMIHTVFDVCQHRQADWWRYWMHNIGPEKTDPEERFQAFLELKQSMASRIEHLRRLVGDSASKADEALEIFNGPSLLLEAGASPAFVAFCRKGCADLELYQTGASSCLELLQGTNAPLAGQEICSFLEGHNLLHHKQQVSKLSEGEILALQNSDPKAGKGLQKLQGGFGAARPMVYTVHSIDGDALGPAQTFGALAEMLDLCRICALVYDSEAASCTSLKRLALVYSQRILVDLEACGRPPSDPDTSVVLLAHSFGCVIAHQIAVQLQEINLSVRLVLYDSEVKFPLAPDESRLGGYTWLGGELEATLQLCRTTGSADLANKAVTQFLNQAPEQRDAQGFKKKVQDMAVARGMTEEAFNRFVDKGAQAMDHLESIARDSEPHVVFHGETLLVLASDSPESAVSAREENTKVCSRMTTVSALGSHYNMMSQFATATANATKIFLQKHGHDLTRISKTPAHGITCLREGDGPCVYMVHGIDGDCFGSGQAYKAMAAVMEPCRVCAMVYTEEALACESMPSLASVYNKYVLEDLKNCGKNVGDLKTVARGEKQDCAEIVITGHSFGVVIAHQMALQMQLMGLEVRLVLYDFEVQYPPAPAEGRLGGYEWLGGEIEAALLVCRFCGKFEEAVQAVQNFLAADPDKRDAKAFREQVAGYAASRGMTKELFEHFVSKGARNMDQLNKIARPWEPQAVFNGQTLLVLAAESPEFAEPARKVNPQFCSHLETVYSLGTHYNVMSTFAAATSNATNIFLQKHSSYFARWSKQPAHGTTCLREGDGPCIYMVHGIDGECFGAGQQYKAIAAKLEPFRVCAMVYTEEALACETIPSLGSVYNRYVLQDLRNCGKRVGGPDGAEIVIAGHSFGVVIAHQMALQMQMMGLNVRLILYDMEVKYPPGPTEGRLGGYDWLGGELEATLLVCRFCGKFSEAREAVQEFIANPEKRDAQAFKQKVQAFAASRNMNQELFEHFVTKAGRNMQQLDKIARPWEPQAVFHGEALLVLAEESPEFAEPSREVNPKFCSKLEIVTGAGSHYTIMSEFAESTSEITRKFLTRP
eukprot:TRINITY_DN3545_c0_g1_i2.p1 TRINITY_DN3545_c0_g1~~TRINITY_DN3545_c0_g1_i2.p1  ORF type:complete len:1885 (+),score=369.45 TRINITY_DN3545_c0_g1_i2:20-5674(+)